MCLIHQLAYTCIRAIFASGENAYSLNSGRPVLFHTKLPALFELPLSNMQWLKNNTHVGSKILFG